MSTHKLRIPEKIVIKKNGEHSGTFTVKPLEPSSAHAVGNPLRRFMLSILEGWGISHMKFPKGVKHMFDTIPGVTEDMIAIRSNLKQVRFKSKQKRAFGEELSPEALRHDLKIEVKGTTALRAADLVVNHTFLEVCNPDFVICNLDEQSAFTLELIVQRGRGYELATSDNLNLEKIEGYENLDVIFSPIKNVQYAVSNCRVGNRADYEALEISVETDGSITPQEAIEEAAYYLIQHFNQIVQKEVVVESRPHEEIKLDKKTLQRQRDLRTRLADLGLSPRAYNGFRAHNCENLGDIASRSLAEISKFRNFGSVTIKEVQALLASKNLEFGMDLSPYHLDDDFSTEL